jgi:hypothetical protein
MLADPDRKTYRAFNLKRLSLFRVFSPSTSRLYFDLLRQGRRVQIARGMFCLLVEYLVWVSFLLARLASFGTIRSTPGASMSVSIVANPTAEPPAL